MQSLEIVVILAGLIFAVLLMTGIYRTGNALWIGASVAILLIAAQIAWQGYRWHMIPAYTGIALALACAGVKRRLRIAGAILSVLALSAAATVCYLFPVFALPAPTGGYPVGTLTLVIVDQDRLPHEQDGHPGRREVPVQLFYPARHGAAGDRAFYMARAETTRLKPQVSLVRIRAISNAGVADRTLPYPVLIYSPSWGGNRHENTNLLEDLASHGYIVASLDVPGETMMTVFPDGRLLRTRDDPWLDFSSQDGFERTRLVVNRHLTTRVADARSVLDRLAWLNDHDPSGRFYHRIDLSRAGALGFSFGGSTAAELCRQDSRFKAGVNLDGFSFGLLSNSDIPCAFMVFGSGGDAPVTPPDAHSIPFTPYDRLCANDYAHQVKSLGIYGGYILTLRGATHVNFSDMPFYSRLRTYTGAGSIEPVTAVELTRWYVLGFFDHELRGFAEKAFNHPGALNSPQVTVFSPVRSGSGMKGVNNGGRDNQNLSSKRISE